jgi:hypothetical protein|tara:strand:- start:35 stop:355 length:321 start_codon:yes stop_codon:yes gene_type:complete
MKKLSKKNQKIIDNVKDSIEISLIGLREFHSEGRYEMVRHCQRSIKEALNGISHYLIHADHNNWSKLKDAMSEIEHMHELSYSYYDEIDMDKFISEADYDKYVAKA